MLTNRLSASRRIFITVMRVLLVLAAVLTAALVVFMIVYVLSKGLPYVTWHLLSTKPSYVSGTIGILPDICNTVQILLASLLIVLPLGVGAAVYLTEYAQNKSSSRPSNTPPRRSRASRPSSTVWSVCCFSVNFWGCRPPCSRAR